MDGTIKRTYEQTNDDGTEYAQQTSKCVKLEIESRFSSVEHAKGKFIPKHILAQMPPEDLQLIEEVKSDCLDLDKIKMALELRKKYRLNPRIPDSFCDTNYYIQNGLRKVYPYPYLYQTFTKRRWISKKLKDILKLEFRDISDQELNRRFDSDRILVNGAPVGTDYILKDNDFVVNRNHRHELPVLAAPIKIIHEDKDTLVIDKPPSMPIHPCGRYRYNSILYMLSKEHNIKNIKIVHRLDRLVSGVLIIAKNTARAHMLENMISNRDVQKEYVCRVSGEFPLSTKDDEDWITVNEPLDTIPGKIGITVVHSNGKDSVTRFKRLNYNGKTSTVICKPLTGRMHQIRVHLQYLGHPIVNDALYNSDAFGPERGKAGKIGKTFSQLSMDVLNLHRANTWMITDNGFESISSDANMEVMDIESNKKTAKFLSQEEREETLAALGHYFTKESLNDLEQEYGFDASKLFKEQDCRDCATEYHDPPLRGLFLYLHALRYSGTGWTYSSDMPVWTNESWKF